MPIKWLRSVITRYDENGGAVELRDFPTLETRRPVPRETAEDEAAAREALRVNGLYVSFESTELGIMKEA